MTPARPPVVSSAEWTAALTAMSERERTAAAAMHELGAARKRMPMVRVEHDYRFEGPDGERSLPELFDGRSQLILYRFFFEEGVAGWPDAGCVGCSSVADAIPNLGLLHSRDITFAMVSPAPQANLRLTAPSTPALTSIPCSSRACDRDLLRGSPLRTRPGTSVVQPGTRSPQRNSFTRCSFSFTRLRLSSQDRRGGVRWARDHTGRWAGNALRSRRAPSIARCAASSRTSVSRSRWSTCCSRPTARSSASPTARG